MNSYEDRATISGARTPEPVLFLRTPIPSPLALVYVSVIQGRKIGLRETKKICCSKYEELDEIFMGAFTFLFMLSYLNFLQYF